MWEFFKSFLANLLATLAGVGLGVPLALWLNRRVHEAARSSQLEVERRAAGAREAADQALLWHALRVLEPAIRHNGESLRAVGELIRAKGVHVTGLPLNTSAWDATKGAVVPLLRDPDLCLRLAHHFGELALFVSHVERHADYFFGVSSSLGNAESTRAYLGEQLVPFAQRLTGDAKVLAEAVAAARTHLRVPEGMALVA